MRKKELIAQLAEREAQIARLEQRIQTMDGLIEGYHSRETAIVNALTHAHETAAEVVEEAEKRAKEILDEAEAAAAETRKRAQTDADGMLEQARSHSAQLLTQAEATVSEYETTIAAYNAALEQAAAEAAANAQRFAAFSRGHKIQPADLTEEVDGLHELPFAPRMDLPDPEGNPAQLMHNIYRIQNRVPPEGGAPVAPPRRRRPAMTRRLHRLRRPVRSPGPGRLRRRRCARQRRRRSRQRTAGAAAQTARAAAGRWGRGRAGTHGGRRIAKGKGRPGRRFPGRAIGRNYQCGRTVQWVKTTKTKALSPRSHRAGKTSLSGIPT